MKSFVQSPVALFQWPFWSITTDGNITLQAYLYIGEPQVIFMKCSHIDATQQAQTYSYYRADDNTQHRPPWGTFGKDKPNYSMILQQAPLNA